MIRTRYILEPVIEQNNLNVSATSHFFPHFAALVKMYAAKDKLAKPFLGMKSYAWGGEKIVVKKIVLPEALNGKKLKLIAGEKNTYQLFSPDDELILTGKVGASSTTSKYPGLRLSLSALTARPGTQFDLVVQKPVVLVDKLVLTLQVKNVIGSDPMQSTGIFQLLLTSDNPQQAMQVLNSIINYTVTRNLEQKSQETQRTLKFLNHRYPN